MFDAFRSWLELGYFASGPIVALGAILALRQISLLKKQLSLLEKEIQLRNLRASKEKAIECVQRYAIYVELVRKFDEQLDKEGLPTFEGDVTDFSPESLPPEWIEIAEARNQIREWIPAINELDTLATAFTTGVACDETGFRTIGRTYCASVGHLYDLICRCRPHGANPHFESLVELYNVWSQRLSAEELRVARKEFDEKISEIPERIIPSIGVG